MSASSFTRLAGACALLACPVALTSFFLLPVAFQGDFDAVFEPARGISTVGVRAGMVRWAWFLDIVGYYFLLLPAVLVLAERERGASPLASRLGELAAYGYMITGAAGAAILAGSTALFAAWQQADAGGRVVVEQIYVVVFNFVDKGLWNLLCMSLLAVWLLLAGRMLSARQRPLGLAMMAIGGCSALDVLGGLSGAHGLSMAGLMGYLFGFPVWSAALGLHLLRSARDA